jgi:hypothetical protein
MGDLSVIMVRIPKKVEKQWVLRHEKDGLDEYGISVFLKLEYGLQNFERMPDQFIIL